VAHLDAILRELERGVIRQAGDESTLEESPPTPPSRFIALPTCVVLSSLSEWKLSETTVAAWYFRSSVR
jgi:hypothetical protein